MLVLFVLALSLTFVIYSLVCYYPAYLAVASGLAEAISSILKEMQCTSHELRIRHGLFNFHFIIPGTQ
jgi:uncharacterized membrane protein